MSKATQPFALPAAPNEKPWKGHPHEAQIDQYLQALAVLRRLQARATPVEPFWVRRWLWKTLQREIGTAGVIRVRDEVRWHIGGVHESHHRMRALVYMFFIDVNFGDLLALSDAALRATLAAAGDDAPVSITQPIACALMYRRTMRRREVREGISAGPVEFSAPLNPYAMED